MEYKIQETKIIDENVNSILCTVGYSALPQTSGQFFGIFNFGFFKN